MKIRTLLAILMFALLLGFGCASVRQSDMLTPNFSLSKDYPNTTHAEVRKAILEACIGRGWNVDSKTDSLIVATLHHNKERVTVHISYSKNHVKIAYKSSVNLLHEKKNGRNLIHKSYNRWVKNLEHDIKVKLLK